MSVALSFALFLALSPSVSLFLVSLALSCALALERSRSLSRPPSLSHPLSCSHARFLVHSLAHYLCPHIHAYTQVTVYVKGLDSRSKVEDVQDSKTHYPCVLPCICTLVRSTCAITCIELHADRMPTRTLIPTTPCQTRTWGAIKILCNALYAQMTAVWYRSVFSIRPRVGRQNSPARRLR